jgi:hypothetical protein
VQTTPRCLRHSCRDVCELHGSSGLEPCLTCAQAFLFIVSAGDKNTEQRLQYVERTRKTTKVQFCWLSGSRTQTRPGSQSQRQQTACAALRHCKCPEACRAVRGTA